jgi:hypothetical protein
VFDQSRVRPFYTKPRADLTKVLARKACGNDIRFWQLLEFRNVGM